MKKIQLAQISFDAKIVNMYSTDILHCFLEAFFFHFFKVNIQLFLMIESTTYRIYHTCQLSRIIFLMTQWIFRMCYVRKCNKSSAVVDFGSTWVDKVHSLALKVHEEKAVIFQPRDRARLASIDLVPRAMVGGRLQNFHLPAFGKQAPDANFFDAVWVSVRLLPTWCALVSGLCIRCLWQHPGAKPWMVFLKACVFKKTWKVL